MYTMLDDGARGVRVLTINSRPYQLTKSPNKFNGFDGRRQLRSVSNDNDELY